MISWPKHGFNICCTLHEQSRLCPCKTDFRLVGSPLPGGTRTLWIATKGFSFPYIAFRRKFYDIQVANGSAITAEAIARIAALYDVEREIRGFLTGIRCEIRWALGRRLVDDLHRWLNKTLSALSCKSDTLRRSLRTPALACLTWYLDDGHTEMDNSVAECALRTVALGRRTPSTSSSTHPSELMRWFDVSRISACAHPRPLSCGWTTLIGKRGTIRPPWVSCAAAAFFH
jgi:hypothetical protein